MERASIGQSGGRFQIGDREIARVSPCARTGRVLKGRFRDAPDYAEKGRAQVSKIKGFEDERGIIRFAALAALCRYRHNAGERALRNPVIGRRLSFGSVSEAGAGFTAMMYSVLGTLSLNGIDPLRWLNAWLTACAENGGRAPGDLSSWLPWSMSAERKRSLTAPG